MTTDNGSSSTEEPNPSEPGRRETTLSAIDTDTDSESDPMLLLVSGETKSTRESHTTQDQEETSDLKLVSASTFKVEETETTTRSSGGSATTAPTKPGTWTEDHFTSQDTH